MKGLGIGRVVGDRYRIESELGSGGMGAVYRAFDEREQTAVAVKTIRPDLCPGPTIVGRFRREAKILDGLAHPGVVRIRDAGILEDDGIFLVMELLDGETLLDRLRAAAPLPLAETVAIVRAICDALDAVHAEGLVHRDIKPSNVFLTSSGEVKLIDFGLARTVEIERLTLSGQVLGTPGYMSPEQLLGHLEVDVRTDVYAVGILAYAALSGRQPFTGDRLTMTHAVVHGVFRSLAQRRPDLPAAVVACVHRAMAASPNERHAGARQLADELEAAASGAREARPPPTGFDGGAKSSSQLFERVRLSALGAAPDAATRRSTWLFVAGVALFLVGLFGLWMSLP